MDEHTSHELAYQNGYSEGHEKGYKEGFLRGLEDGKRDAVKHGHKVVVERHRGVTRYIPCPCCSYAVPSNKPYTEKVEYCSVCGKKLDDTFQNFCPNCGADMREPPKGE